MAATNPYHYTPTPLHLAELETLLEETERALLTASRDDEQRLRDQRDTYARLLDWAEEREKKLETLIGACDAILASTALTRERWPALRTALTRALKKLDA